MLYIIGVVATPCIPTTLSIIGFASNEVISSPAILAQHILQPIIPPATASASPPPATAAAASSLSKPATSGHRSDALYDLLANSLHQMEMCAVVQLSATGAPVPARMALLRSHVTVDRANLCMSSIPIDHDGCIWRIDDACVCCAYGQ